MSPSCPYDGRAVPASRYGSVLDHLWDAPVTSAGHDTTVPHGLQLDRVADAPGGEDPTQSRQDAKRSLFPDSVALRLCIFA